MPPALLYAAEPEFVAPGGSGSRTSPNPSSVLWMGSRAPTSGPMNVCDVCDSSNDRPISDRAYTIGVSSRNCLMQGLVL